MDVSEAGSVREGKDGGSRIWDGELVSGGG